MKFTLYIFLILLFCNQTIIARDCANNKYRSNYNVLHYDLSIRFDTTSGHIDGIVKIKAECLANPKTEFQIDLQEPLKITTIRSGAQILNFRKKGEKYFVRIPELIKDETFLLVVEYNGIPKIATRPPWDGGMVKTKDPKGKIWMAMACQGIGASVWFPCKDYDADEPEQGVDLHYSIPNGLVAVGNGKLVNVINAENNHNVWNWKVVAPINIYNITFNIGNYLRISEQMNSENGALTLDYFVLSQNYTKAKEHFKMVPKMMNIFENWMGPYPFFNDGYKLVETPFLGMEHQSAVAYGNNYQMGYDGRNRSGSEVDTLFDFIIVHETGHEWFGNNISISDPAYFWIHEGFTSYTEVMYIESMWGKEKAIDYLIGTRKIIRNEAPMQSALGQCKNSNIDNYPKGANLIHNIRKLMKDDAAFKNMIRKMNKNFHHKVISGADMESFIIQESGLQLGKVFDQYLRNKQLPTLKIVQHQTGFNYKWANCIREFDMPVLILIDGKEKWLHPTTQEQSHFQNGIETITPQKEFYCDFKLE